MATPLRNIRVSDEEWAAWANEAALSGLTVSGLIRLLVNRAVGRESEPKDARAVKPPENPGRPKSPPKVAEAVPAMPRAAVGGLPSGPKPVPPATLDRPARSFSKSDQAKGRLPK